MKFVLATHNKHKVKELCAMLSVYLPNTEILSLDDVGITDEIQENGTTFVENALIKASAAAKSGYIGLGDDSGLVVSALDGRPGIYSARYSGVNGEGCDRANNKKLLDELTGISDRSAAFVCSLACVFPDGSEPITVIGYAEGEILLEERGENGFGYDPLFWFDPYGKTFAEMTDEEKNEISHRANAVRFFVAELRRRLGTPKTL